MADALLSLGPYRLRFPINPHADARVPATRQGEPASQTFLLDCYVTPNDPDFVYMWADEASLAVRVRHRNLLPLVEIMAAPQTLAIRPGDERPPWDFLVAVYEHTASVSLRRLLRSVGRVPPSIAVSLACGMLSALEAVHGWRTPEGEPLGILFRDLSLGEAWLALDGRFLLTNLAGLRRRLSQPSDPAGMVEMLPSSFLFFSPEALQGQPREVRDNLWSAALILWTLLSGSVLYKHESTVVSLRSIMDHLRPPLAQLAPDLPPALLAVLERATHRERTRRHASAAELREDLRAALEPASEAEVAAWAELRGLVALAHQEEEPPPPYSFALPEGEEEPEALSYRDIPRTREPPRRPRRPASSPIPPSLWRRMQWWWARRRRP